MSPDQLEAIKLFGNELIDVSDLGELALRFLINVVVLWAIVRMIFYKIYRQKNYVFTFVMVNLSVFLVCILLSSVKLKIGFAFGLFAVFSIIRYRTEQIPIREMTYLFLVIIIAVMNSLSIKKISYAEVVLGDLILISAVYFMEKVWLTASGGAHRVRYEKIELIKPDKREELIKDLKERTGLDVYRVDIERINFLNDTARLKVFYNNSSRKDKES